MAKKDEFPPYQTFKEHHWLRKNWVELFTIVGGLVVINLIFLSDAFRGDKINAENASYLGAFISGYIGTFFVLVSVVFLYSTLKDQRLGSNIEKFESKYFELLSLHRDNVIEIGIGKDSGKKIFVILVRELRAISRIVKMVSKQNGGVLKTAEGVLVVSYVILFYGVGFNSTRMLKTALSYLPEDFVNDVIQALLNSKKNEGTNLKYRAFDGHQSRLGHYYRHLYQTVRFVDEKTGVNIDKYSYVKTVRAQLTNHEQALLFINSLSPLGYNWLEKGYLIRYKLVKNLPQGFFADYEIDIKGHFPGDYFEWQTAKTAKQWT